MITRLEIDGFKTLSSVAFDLAPFQAIAGPVDAGTSNVLDAVALVAALAEFDLRTAFSMVRGEPLELFTFFPDGRCADRMTLAVEMLAEPVVEDSWGARADVRYTRMRYELVIERGIDARGVETMHVLHEALLPIARHTDAWARRHLGDDRERWLPPLRSARTSPFIATVEGGRGRGGVHLHQDGRGGEMATMAHAMERTALSTIGNTEFPHAFAAREEMRGWRRFDLEPHAIRGGRPAYPHTFIGPDGGNLTAALARMKGEDPSVLDRISRGVSAVMPQVADVLLDDSEGFYRQRIRIMAHDGAELPFTLLSDAALRVLAMAALKNDPDGGGVLAFDEPENGMDAGTLPRLAPFLCGLATDLRAPVADAADPPARLLQGLVTTHSPGLVNALAAELTARADGPVHELPELLLAQRAEPHSGDGLRSTRIVRVRPSQQLELDLGAERDADDVATLFQVEKALCASPE